MGCVKSMKIDEVTMLIDLTEEFVEFLSDLLQEKAITEEQFKILAEKKLEFIERNKIMLMQ